MNAEDVPSAELPSRTTDGRTYRAILIPTGEQGIRKFEPTQRSISRNARESVTYMGQGWTERTSVRRDQIGLPISDWFLKPLRTCHDLTQLCCSIQFISTVRLHSFNSYIYSHTNAQLTELSKSRISRLVEDKFYLVDNVRICTIERNHEIST